MIAIDRNALIDEILRAFEEAPPPGRCAPEEHIAYDDAEDLDYLEGKSWTEIANDPALIARHHFEQFFFMTRESLVYLLPGYLLGVVKHPPESTARVQESLLTLLWRDQFVGGGMAYEMHAFAIT